MDQDIERVGEKENAEHFNNKRTCRGRAMVLHNLDGGIHIVL